jgi:ornithine carbamoyltransferase
MCRELAGELVVLYLTQPSTRTRVTFSAAAARLGAAVVVVGPTEFQLGYGAPVEAIARTVSLYAGVVVARTDDHDLARLAGGSTIPVVNGLSERDQPCQGVADAIAIADGVSTLDGLRIAFVGDGANMAMSLLEMCGLGAELVVATPPDHALDPAVLRDARRLSARVGGSVTVGGSADEAVAGADVVYLSPLHCAAPSHGSEMPCATGATEAVDRLMAPAAAHAPLLVCQPTRLASHVARDLVRHPRSRLRQQADNRIYAAAAMLVAAHQGRLEGVEVDDDVDLRALAAV